MSRILDKQKARALRAQGKSYSEIKAILNVGKGTLSDWLKDMPLTAEQIHNLRDINPRRIEKFRETMRLKRESRLSFAYDLVRKDIGTITKREAFIAGLYLYWAEGTKSMRGKNEITNTDPALINAFQQWLKMRGVPLDKICVRLQLYKDMDVTLEQKYWSHALQIPLSRFRKASIKDSTYRGLSRKRGHGHGTCDLIFDNVSMWEYITMALKYIREQHMRP